MTPTGGLPPTLPPPLGEAARRIAARARCQVPLDGFSPAAVAVPLVQTPAGLALLFTVRTYVTSERKPGIWCLSLDATNALAVALGRYVRRMPYHRAWATTATRGAGGGARSRHSPGT